MFDHNLVTPETTDQAKEYACAYSARSLSEAELLQRIEGAKRALENPFDEESRAYWSRELNQLEQWSESEEFKEGKHPQGIDEIFLELIEWRAMFYAFQDSETSSTLFRNNIFFQQWRVGGIYVMFARLGKLLSSDKRDRSLRHLWGVVSEFIDNDIGGVEIRHLSNQFGEEGRLTSKNSKALEFRNKVVAHNERSHGINLTDLDKDLQLIARVWSIIVTWSSFGIVLPWRENEAAFQGLEHFFGQEEMSSLKSRRQQYLAQVEEWCRTNVVTSKIEQRSPFTTISVKVAISPSNPRAITPE